MPAPIDLTGRPFGRLKVLGPDHKETARRKRLGDNRRYWKCQCKRPCGRLVTVSGSNLTSGNTKSCGCLFNATVARNLPSVADLRREHKRAREIIDSGDTFYSRSKAAEYLGKSPVTIAQWAGLSGKTPGCPFLNGDAIESRILAGANGREAHYFAKSDLDRIIRARSKRATPEYPGLTLLHEAAKQLSLSAGRVVRVIQGHYPDMRTERLPGRDATGRATKYVYLPTRHVEATRAILFPPRSESHDTHSAAAKLGISRSLLLRWLREGKVPDAEKVAAVCVSHDASGKEKFRSTHEQWRIPVDAVERLKRVRRGEPAARVEPPAAAPAAHSPPEAGSRPTRIAAGRPLSEQTAALYKFCWEKYRHEGKKAAAVMVLANATFKGAPIKDESYVKIYAGRHAKRFENKG